MAKSTHSLVNQKGERQCFTISARWNGDEDINFDNFTVELAFKFSNESRLPGTGEVLFSDEDNSFGLAGGVWFDGPVDCFPMVYTGAMFKIVEVTEYLHLTSLCSPEVHNALIRKY